MHTGARTEFWCYSDAYLSEVFAKFYASFAVSDADVIHDQENVWEWFEGRTADRTVRFNICRPHESLDEFGIETRPVPGAPVRFILDGYGVAIHLVEIGEHLAQALGIPVHTGEVIYGESDEFEYRVARTFRPAMNRDQKA